MEQTERKHLIEWLSLIGNFGKEYLDRQPDQEIERLYNLRIKQMNEE
ncbi:BH0509 family protein [Bacillus atrophaeus]|nr:BH0509 family protein [Bacillus atrophaeus]MCY8952056.1 BH0509 family protein [Bacillus atrophaeus]